ncbi:sulfurtransferase TusA family protein [Acinetobacter nosocomialis]|uniref:Oxidoreductase n=2 Tax=Acinetobacter nosocomialis TaxID=106654 RepID=A0AB36LXD7_ACINO|nr:sulfurtransferase TusA family protein [Acinetobacter nosocomialis]EXB70901.1 sirA-like family protein [Acinetobacter sp. 21871]EXR65844.1 sirA-like family protein [Acinetobacter sp. 1424608]EXT39981.1 sirA-like family protein [Acinetobacter sp. 25977_8]EXT47344.1 sirA-like family protein [Acinetobacter sp. 25977_7]EXT47795.1 sirA-like family protein [Acinetobacter sp. 25977_6]EXT51561.1 sirA-like family protein [Acinetobacter sp. 25977_4]EXT56426.1 sirA-like family protein [Acinetobacter 
MSTTSSAVAPIEINALGQPCPMPLLMLKRELKKASGKQLFLLKSSDPHSEIDVTRYCTLHHFMCQTMQISEREFHYLIETQ